MAEWAGQGKTPGRAARGVRLGLGGLEGGGWGGVKGELEQWSRICFGVKCERCERCGVCVGGRTGSGEGVVAGRSNLRQGAVRKKWEEPAATGGRTARVADSQIRRFSDVQMFRFSVFSGHTGLSLHDATTSLLDAARLDSGVQTAPAGTDVKVFRQQASKQASKKARAVHI